MKIPIATYRLQFQPEFGFGRAADIVSYLSELGISHIYASPIFRARKGSTHGYDCVDPNALNPELGKDRDWQCLLDRLQAHDMGWLQDIVPNHMAYHIDNRMLTDVLESGPASKFYDFFDISWEPDIEGLQGKVMAPFLGRRYSECIKDGEIRLTYDAAGFAALYGELRFPLLIDSYLYILDHRPAALKDELGEKHPDYLHWMDALDQLESLAVQHDPVTRRDQCRGVKQTLWDLSSRNDAIGRYISETLQRFNGEPGHPESFHLLDHLLAGQLFRLCHWKNANNEINYRRFFDINELITLRQENNAVFEYTHALLGELSAEGSLDGVRIDHVDGLADPAAYLKNLRRCLDDEAYILVEKILTPHESLPESWPVQGTTGYDFCHWLNALFVNSKNESRFDEIYDRFRKQSDAFEQVVGRAKKSILSTRMAGDLDNLARRIKLISARMRFADNLTLHQLKAALTEVLARFPVYRTYNGREDIRDVDRQIIETATSRSVQDRPDLAIELNFISELLLDTVSFDPAAEAFEVQKHCREAVWAFQQLSATLMAKGFEDTAFYRYHRLVSLNEVGGEPALFGCGVEEFHQKMVERARHWPHAMNSTATHDSKRGEDVRARLNVLSEVPAEWEACLKNWHALVRDRRRRTASGLVPDKHTEYLLYQTLIGVWPVDGGITPPLLERIRAFMIKAVREAGELTGWLDPDNEYEAALLDFVEAILGPSPQNDLLPAIEPFALKIAFFGLFNSLSQCLLKITAPGVPDFYQGAELPQLVLVDPDNRRPVDFDQRKGALEFIRTESSGPLNRTAALLANRKDGKIKLFVIARALEARQRLRELFEKGCYLPLDSSGPFERNVVAFARESENRWCITVVPRFVTELVGENQEPLGDTVWQGTVVYLPESAPRTWRHVFTGQTIQAGGNIAVGSALADFPVALLVGEPSS